MAAADHPARLFGARLKKHRRDRHIVARLLADKIGQSASRYCEVEHGIIGSFSETDLTRFCAALAVSGQERAELDAMLARIGTLPALTMRDIFQRDELMPMFPRHRDGRRMTIEEVDGLMDAVFAAA